MTLARNQIHALRQLQRLWPDRGLVIIGATALGFHYDMRWRETSDIDLLLAVELDEFPGPVAQLPGWQQHKSREHQFVSSQGARIDILPAGPELVAAGSLTWPSGHTMSLVGMDLAFAHTAAKPCADGYSAIVAAASVIVILKMASYCDRPAERERDLDDIAYLLEVYEDENSQRRWEEAAEQSYDLGSAYLLGLDIGAIASPAHVSLVRRFLTRVGDPDGAEHGLMQRRGPAHWARVEQALRDRLDAFEAGLRDGAAHRSP